MIFIEEMLPTAKGTLVWWRNPQSQIWIPGLVDSWELTLSADGYESDDVHIKSFWWGELIGDFDNKTTGSWGSNTEWIPPDSYPTNCLPKPGIMREIIGDKAMDVIRRRTTAHAVALDRAGFYPGYVKDKMKRLSKFALEEKKIARVPPTRFFYGLGLE
jgi:hypothetical protein